MSRTHDNAVYLREDRHDEPKEIFKVLADQVMRQGVLTDKSVVCDFGCAPGEFLYHLRGQFPQADYHGYDAMPELIERARARVPGVTFDVGSVLDRSAVSGGFADVAFMLGVHSIFDEFQSSFLNLLHWTRKGGKIYIFGLFNEFPLDVWVKYRLAGYPDPDHRESGWNLFSRASVARFLDAHIGPGKHTCLPFEPPFSLPPHRDDPIRTWTFSDEHGRRLFTNGLSLICNLQILESSR